VYGPYLELGTYPEVAHISTALTLKAGLYGTVDLLYRSGHPDAGVGGTIGGLVELSGRTDGVFSNESRDGSVVCGAVRGVGQSGSSARDQCAALRTAHMATS
jgi:hypothetical protein